MNINVINFSFSEFRIWRMMISVESDCKKKLKDGKWGKQGIDKGCSLCCWLEAVITFEALWGFSLELRHQYVWSSRYYQINDVKCKHFILWSGPEPEPDKNVYINEVYEILRHRRLLQRHIPCKPQPHIKKNPEEFYILEEPWCLALIISIFCDSYMKFAWQPCLTLKKAKKSS